MSMEPPIGSVILVTHHAGHSLVYERKTRHIWKMTGSESSFAWCEITYGPSVAHIRTLYVAPTPEPPEDSLVLVVHPYGAIEVYWHGINGWFQTGSTDCLPWSEITENAIRVVLLSVGEELKVEL